MTPHPRVAIQSLIHDLMDADKKMDQLMGRVPSLRNARDLDAWGQELQQQEIFFSETELRITWSIENEQEIPRL